MYNVEEDLNIMFNEGIKDLEGEGAYEDIEFHFYGCESYKNQEEYIDFLETMTEVIVVILSGLFDYKEIKNVKNVLIETKREDSLRINFKGEVLC